MRARRYWKPIVFLAASLGVLVGILALVAFTPQDRGGSETTDPQVDNITLLPLPNPVLQETLLAMLNSDKKWESLSVRASYVEYAYQANVQNPSALAGDYLGKTTFIEDIQVRQPGEVVYYQFLDGDSSPRYQVTLHAGKLTETSLVQDNSLSEDSTSRNISVDYLRHEESFLPRSLEEIKPGYIVDHPLVRLIPARSMEMLFPTWLAQQAVSQNRLTYEGKAVLSGRSVSIVRLEKTGSGAASTAWVDDATGILLRYRYEVDGTLLIEYEVLELEVK